MEIEINWFRAFFNFSEGINWFVMAYLLVMWRWLSVPFKWLAAYFMLATLGLAISNSVYIFFDLNNRFYFHLETPIQFIFLSMIFYVIIESAFIKRVIMVLNILFSIFSVINALYIESFWYSSPSIPETILHVAVISYTIYFIFNLYITNSVKVLNEETNIVLVLSLFFYFSSTLVLSMTDNFLGMGYKMEIQRLYYTIVCFMWIIHIGGILYALRIIYKDNIGQKTKDFSTKNLDEIPF